MTLTRTRSRAHAAEHMHADVGLLIMAAGYVFAAMLLYIVLVSTWGVPADIAMDEWLF